VRLQGQNAIPYSWLQRVKDTKAQMQNAKKVRKEREENLSKSFYSVKLSPIYGSQTHTQSCDSI
jgi:hypothetical protein